jgi:tRNA A22 N-methylase
LDLSYLTPEKEVDLMLEFSRIKTELIDLHEKESDYPALSIAEAKQIEKYKQIRVAAANLLDQHKGKAFHPKNAIDEPYIKSVDSHLTEERLEQIIDYATNISAIVKGVLESGKLKKVT